MAIRGLKRGVPIFNNWQTINNMNGITAAVCHCSFFKQVFFNLAENDNQ